MDAVIYGSIIALAIVLLTIYLVMKKRSNQEISLGENEPINQDKQSTIANAESQRSISKKNSRPSEPKPETQNQTQPHLSVAEPATTLRVDQIDNNFLTVNGMANGSQNVTTPPTSSSTANTDVLLLLPTEADNSLNTKNAFKPPPGNLRIFSLYSDFVNEVSDDVQNITDSFLHGINNLIASDYHLLEDDEWRSKMEQNGRLAHMTSRYVKRYRYPHYAGHIHQMLVTCLNLVTSATDLIDESFANAVNGETDQAKSKLRNCQVLLNKSPKYLEYCNSAMGACYLELSRHI